MSAPAHEHRVPLSPGSPGSPCHSPEPPRSAIPPTKLLSELSNDLSRFINSEELADVHFLVGEEEVEFHAHRFLLAARSKPFAALLFGRMRESEGTQDSRIPIPNIAPDVFEQLLKYIYSGVVVIHPANVLPLLQAADQYDVRHLRELCISYAFSNIHEQSVFTLWETSKVLCLEDLERKCARFIANNAKVLIEEEVVCGLHEDTLMELLKLDSLHNVEEVQLFRCVLAWTKRKCAERNLEPSGKNLQAVGGMAARLVRLPLISARDIVTVVETSGLVSLKQCYWALAYQATRQLPRKVPEKWLQPRNQVTPPARPWKWDRCHPALKVELCDITRTGDTNGHHSAMATEPLISGRTYWEVSLARLSKTGSDFAIVGLVRESFNPSTYVGGCASSWGYSIRSVKYHAGKDSYYGQVCNEGDTIGVMYDSIRGEITFFRNKISMGVAFTDVSGIVYPAVTLYTPSDRVTICSEAEAPQGL